MDARRLIPVAALVTALLVLAGIASHGRPLSTGVGTGPSASFFDYVATTLILLGVLVVVGVAVIVKSAPRDAVGKAPRGRHRLISSLLAFVSALLLAELFLHSRFEQRLQQLAQQQQEKQQGAGAARHAPGEPKNLRNARVRWDEVAVVLVLLGGVGVYLFLARGRGGPLRPLAARRRAAVSRALDDSLDDLRTDPDVRRAIIAAYARMERALALVGVARDAAETPFEYLERSLLELDASADAARQLTDLFERAKFSHHEPDEAMRGEAIDALAAVRDDLRTTAAEPAAA